MYTVHVCVPHMYVIMYICIILLTTNLYILYIRPITLLQIWSYRLCIQGASMNFRSFTYFHIHEFVVPSPHHDHL